MNIKKIIKESLIKEIGEASTKPYPWKLEDKLSSADKGVLLYSFITTGGSNLKINVSFHSIAPKFLVYLVDFDVMMGTDDKDFIVNNPYYYWDVEFEITEYAGEELIDAPGTISTSKYKTDKVEVFRIMSTLSKIVKDVMVKNKVRGFAFKPASTSRGTIFNKFFQKQLPSSKIIGTQNGGFIIVVNDSIEAPSNTDVEFKRDWRRKFFNNKLK